MQARTYHESQKKPIYAIRETLEEPVLNRAIANGFGERLATTLWPRASCDRPTRKSLPRLIVAPHRSSAVAE